MKNYLLPTIICLLLQVTAVAQDQPRKSYTTTMTQTEIIIDGKIDDTAWEKVEWGGDFVGHQPKFMAVPTEQTKFKVLYDDKYIYFAIRSLEADPSKIENRMSRRDGFPGDRVTVNIDSYHDKRTAFSFTASSSGVKGDEYVSNNGDSWDDTWDPIWYLKTSIDEYGWVAEMKIPLSQLRFANKENHTWGLQVIRQIFRADERSIWQPIDPNAAGWVHLFGELNGISGIKPQKQLEIMPYVVGKAQIYPKEEDNPFKESGKEFDGNIGLDAKIGITSDITLDLTINPDFGQVEADPSTVNLSAFRLFFREQRPFFLEGNNILTFPTSGGRNNLYYSRRVGGKPSGYPQADDIDYVNQPNQTRILGAAKITGKNAKGFSWGLMESFTNREYARVSDTLGTQRDEQVEAYTNYLVSRVQQDFGGGKTVVGAYYSQVNRIDNNVNGLELLHNNAKSGGIDINHNFKNRNYGFEAKVMMSNVQGSRDAIYETQTASERYFQRPDNNYQDVDSTRTSLTGSASTFSFGKRSGSWRWRVGSNYKSPEFEINDVGFLVQTDVINNWLYNSYRINEPTSLFRRQRYDMYIEQNLDFGGTQTTLGLNLEVNWDFNNLWETGYGTWIETTSVSNADLRGGPSISYPGGTNFWYYIASNGQKKFSGGFNQRFYRGVDDYANSHRIRFWFNYQPTNALKLSLRPTYSTRNSQLQYIDQFTSGGQTDYLMGSVKQHTYNLSFRANYNITPNLTFEFWGQPFIAVGEYSEFKWAAETNHSEYDNRFQTIDDNDIAYFVPDNGNSPYYVIEDNTDYQFDDPDFNIVEFRSNFVMRWEYIPGSTLFLVWSNNGSYFGQEDNNDFSDLSQELTNLEGTNTFLIKYTYRFIL
ncbi:MAG: carbohydrate binding family 9 domain-containing protein [Reichenbachiella sp.]